MLNDAYTDNSIEQAVLALQNAVYPHCFALNNDGTLGELLHHETIIQQWQARCNEVKAQFQDADIDALIGTMIGTVQNKELLTAKIFQDFAINAFFANQYLYPKMLVGHADYMLSVYDHLGNAYPVDANPQYTDAAGDEGQAALSMSGNCALAAADTGQVRNILSTCYDENYLPQGITAQASWDYTYNYTEPKSLLSDIYAESRLEIGELYTFSNRISGRLIEVTHFDSVRPQPPYRLAALKDEIEIDY